AQAHPQRHAQQEQHALLREHAQQRQPERAAAQRADRAIEALGPHHAAVRMHHDTHRDHRGSRLLQPQPHRQPRRDVQRQQRLEHEQPGAAFTGERFRQHRPAAHHLPRLHRCRRHGLNPAPPSVPFQLVQEFLEQAFQLRRLGGLQAGGLALKQRADRGHEVVDHRQPPPAQAQADLAPVLGARGALDQSLVAQTVCKPRDVGRLLARRLGQLRGIQRVALGAVQHHQDVVFRVTDAPGLEQRVGVVVHALVEVLDQPHQHRRLARKRGLAPAGDGEALFGGGEAAHGGTNVFVCISYMKYMDVNFMPVAGRRQAPPAGLHFRAPAAGATMAAGSTRQRRTRAIRADPPPHGGDAMKRWLLLGVSGLLLGAAAGAMADEGMWTLDHLPTKQLQQRYGFTPTPQWIDLIQHAAVRLAEGCSGSFVSADGLVMTNHHCANACLSQLSGSGHNYMADGYVAMKPEDEPKCPDVELNQLDSITDVTARVNAATNGKTGAERIKAERAIDSQLEEQCVAGDAKSWRCDVISLYHGGRYALYKYRRYQDVRLVFAPEQSIAFFGGDPDNFNFPRYDLDVTFFRAWVGGKPAKTPQFLKFDPHGPKAGELTFVVGNPGSTQRETPWIQLSAMRDDTLIPLYGYLSDLRGVLWQYGRAGTQQAKEAQDMQFGIENTLKVFKGWLETLTNEGFITHK